MDDGYDDDRDNTDWDGEFFSGCYELDINPNPVSDVSKIWIRFVSISTQSQFMTAVTNHRAQAVVLYP